MVKLPAAAWYYRGWTEKAIKRGLCANKLSVMTVQPVTSACDVKCRYLDRQDGIPAAQKTVPTV